MNLSEIQSLMDKGHHIYEVWKDTIYVGTRHGKKGGDYYTDPVLQVQAFSDTNRLPLAVTKRFAPIKKLNIGKDVHRWSYGAGYSGSSDIENLLQVFKMAGYPVVRTEDKTTPFGGHYILYIVAEIK